MIDESEIEKAVDWLRDNSLSAAQDRATRLHLEEFRKSLKAIIMKEHTDLPVSAQEREAYADHRYQTHLRALKDAVAKDEYNRFMRHSAEAKIEAWRSLSANHRAIKL